MGSGLLNILRSAQNLRQKLHRGNCTLLEKSQLKKCQLHKALMFLNQFDENCTFKLTVLT
jgi:hypothetical protein